MYFSTVWKAILLSRTLSVYLVRLTRFWDLHIRARILLRIFSRFGRCRLVWSTSPVLQKIETTAMLGDRCCESTVPQSFLFVHRLIKVVFPAWLLLLLVSASEMLVFTYATEWVTLYTDAFYSYDLHFADFWNSRFLVWISKARNINILDM